MKSELIKKSRKEYKCEKCGEVIHKGEPYYRITGMYMKTRFRCAHCAPERSELTTSDYLSWLYNLQDHLDDNYDFESDGVLEEISEELGNMSDDLQSRLDEMPEAFQDTSDAGITLGERIESLNDAQSEIDCLEYPDRDDEEYQVEDDEATFVFDGMELNEELKNAIKERGIELDQRFTSTDLTCFMQAINYNLLAEADEDDVNSEEFDLHFGNGGASITCHFETRTHFDEDLYNDAVSDLRDSVSEVIGNIAE